MISNLYKIKWREEEFKYKKDNGKVNSREIKRQKGRGKVEGREEEFFFFF